MNDEELLERVSCRLNCAIKDAIANNIPISRNRGHRAFARPHGFTTSYWDYRRRVNGTLATTYALDMIIINNPVDHDENHSFALAAALRLPNKRLAHSLDLGFQGADYSDCVQNDLSRGLYYAGAEIRNKWHRYLVNK